MNRALLVGVLWVFLLLIKRDATAEPYKAGDSFNGFAAADQRGASFTFKPGAYRFVIFDVAGETSASTQPKDPNWFEDRHALFLVDVSDLSSFKKRIAKSRMESKPFKILVVDDKTAAARFPRQKEKFTVLRLDDGGKISDIRFAAPGKELQDLLSAGGKP